MRVWLWGGFAVTMSVMLLVSWWPRPVDAALLEVIERVLPGIRSAVADSPAYGAGEIVANVAFYVPLGVIAGALVRNAQGRSRSIVVIVAAAVAAGFVLSLVAESGQALWLPQRYPTGWDVLANTLGVALGGVLAACVRSSTAAERHSKGSRRSDGERCATPKESASG